MKRHWYYDHPSFFQGLTFAVGVVVVAISLCALVGFSGCDFCFGSKIVQILNEGGGGQSGE